MTAIVSWCLRRRSVVILASLLILGAGAYGASQLRQQFFPDVDFPFVITNLDVSGLDAEGVDEQVAQPLESAASNLEEVETTRTLASEGRVTLVTELVYGTDTKQFEEDLARELGSVALPEGAGELDIGGGFDEQAVLNAAISTDGDLVDLTEEAEDVREDLEGIDGVGRVDLEGGGEEEFAVELKERAVRRGETPAGLATKIRSALREAPVGLVERDGSRTPLLVDPGTVDDRRELERLPISDRREVEDVATVRRRPAEGKGFARVNGKPAIALSVFTEEDANQVQVVDDSQAVLARAEDDLGDVEVTTVFETASDVKASVNGLLLEGVLGALFAIVMIFLFLRSVRPTLVAAVSIPTSIVFGLLAAWALGLTLNIITLAGLTIAIGRVIDDAIVVLENIYKHLERGEPRMQAALEGTAEVANAIVSSTLATAAVFLPLGVVGGLISEIFFSFSIIVVVALLASLLVAVTVIPVLGATFMSPRGRPKEEAGALARIVTPITHFGIRPYGRLAVIAAAFAALIGTISVVAGGGIPVQFLPDSGTQQAFGTVDLPAGVGPARAERLLRPLEERLNGVEGIENAQVTFGGAGVQTDEVEDTENGAFFANFEEGVDVNRVTADLRRFGEREYPAGFSADRLEQGPPAGRFEATVVGDDQDDAERAAARVTELLENRGDLTQVDNQAANEQTQFVLEVDRDERGTEDQQRATQALAAIVAAADAGAIGDDDVPVVVRAPSALLESADALEDVPLAPRAGAGAVPPGAGAPPATGVPPVGAVAPGSAAPPGGALPPGGAAPGGGAPPAGGLPPGGAPPGAAPPPGGIPPGGAPPRRAPAPRGPAPRSGVPPSGGDRAHCSNRLDDDSDGRIDFPDDQGCKSATDDSEAPDAPRCSDRLDNDSDGRINFPRDPGCNSPTDDSEAPDASSGGSASSGGAVGGVRGGAGSGANAEAGASTKQRTDVTPAAGGPPRASGEAGAGLTPVAAAGPSGAGAAPAGGGGGATTAPAGIPGAGAAPAGAGAAASPAAPGGAGGASGAGAAPGAPGALGAAASPAAPRSGRLDTVGDVGEVVRQKAAGTLSRVDSEPAVRVSARILGEDVNAINQDIESEVDDLNLANARVDIGGDQEFINQMFTDLGTAILAAIALVFLVLVVFFGSTSQPITILAPVLFSSIGSLLALLVTDAALGLPAMIGQLLLIGIVVANSILLVDTALRQRRLGVGRSEALVSAARLRVRPVLMTALATIVALLPLAAGLSGEGGIISRSLGAVVIGGLLTATLLTLVIVPAVFSTFDGLGHLLGRRFGRRPEPSLAGAPSSSRASDRSIEDAKPDPVPPRPSGEGDGSGNGGGRLELPRGRSERQ